MSALGHKLTYLIDATISRVGLNADIKRFMPTVRYGFRVREQVPVEASGRVSIEAHANAIVDLRPGIREQGRLTQGGMQ